MSKADWMWLTPWSQWYEMVPWTNCSWDSSKDGHAYGSNNLSVPSAASGFSWTTPAAANPSLGPLKWPPKEGCKPNGLNVGHETCWHDPLGSWHMDMQEIGNSQYICIYLYHSISLYIHFSQTKGRKNLTPLAGGEAYHHQQAAWESGSPKVRSAVSTFAKSP